MPAQIYPNLGLKAGYDERENGWADDMTENIQKLSVLTQGGVSEKVAAEPTTPAEGDVVLLDETNATNPNAVAAYIGAEWHYWVPQEGWLIYNRGADYYEKFDGTVWAELATGGSGGGGVEEAPEDDNLYARKNAAWEPIAAAGVASAVATVSDAASNLLSSLEGKYIRFTATSAKTLTVQPDSTAPQADNAEWHIRNAAASNLTIVAGSGVTVNAPYGGTRIVPPQATVTLKRVAANTYDLMGQTT